MNITDVILKEKVMNDEKDNGGPVGITRKYFTDKPCTGCGNRIFEQRRIN